MMQLLLVLAIQVTPAEQKAIGAAADALVDFGTWCRKQGFDADAKEAGRLALGIDPSDKKAKALAEIDAMEMGPAIDEKLKKELDKRRADALSKAAGIFDKLYAAKPKDDKSGRFEAYLLRALELEPSDVKRWGVVMGVVTASINNKKFDEAGTLLGRALALPCPDKVRPELEKKEEQVLQNGPMQKKASAHAMEYFISLPKNYSKAKAWPILVTVEGAGCNFGGNHRGFVDGRGDLPLIIVTPITTSNTNALEPAKYPYPKAVLDEADKGRQKFDGEGLLAVLADVKKRFNGKEKIFITGFSGGGHLTYWMIFAHSEMLAGAAPACGNFASPATAAGEGALGVPIAMFTGEKDEYRDMIEQQTDNAEKALKERGYTNFKRTMLSGVGHSGCVSQVLEFFKGLNP